MNDNLINNARELPKYWDILGKDDGFAKHDVKVEIAAIGKNGRQAILIIDNTNASLLSLIKVCVTRELLKATGANNIQDVVDKYLN